MGRRLLLPKLTDVLFMAVLLASILLGSRMLNTDGDLGRDLALGNVVLSDHTIPTTDILSWTKAGQPRPPYEWLAQALLAIANRALGLDGVVILVSLVLAGAFAFVCADASRRSGLPLTSLLLSAWAALASSLHWLARPHIFSFLFFALWMRNLDRLRSDSEARPWALPVLMLLWANTHGGFLFGFAAWIAYCVGWAWDYRKGTANTAYGMRLLATGAGSLIASVLTPDLWNNWSAVLSNRSVYVLTQTAETMPPQIGMPAVWPFFILLVGSCLLVVLNRRQARLEHVVLLAGLALGGLVMARNIPLFAIAAAPILALWIAEVLEHQRIRLEWEEGFGRLESALVGWVWPAVTALTAIAMLAVDFQATNVSAFSFRPDIFPVRAADWIRDNEPPGRMFNDFNWGGYLLYRLWPEQRVYIDSQSDFYGEAFIREYVELESAGAGWEGTLDENRVGWAVIPPSVPLATQLRQSRAWREAYGDQTAVVFVRASP